VHDQATSTAAAGPEPSEIPVPHRHVAALLTAATIATLAASTAAAGAPVVHRGATARILIHAPQLAACAAEIHYSDGTLQQTAIRSAQAGRILWRVHVPPKAPLGLAHWTARCGISWERTGSWRVVRR
jgi:hypothetical protein